MSVTIPGWLTVPGLVILAWAVLGFALSRYVWFPLASRVWGLRPWVYRAGYFMWAPGLAALWAFEKWDERSNRRAVKRWLRD